MNYQIQRIFFRFQILYNVKKQSNPYSHTNTKKVNFSSFILNYQTVTPIENTIDSHIHSHQYSKISFIFLILQTRRYEETSTYNIEFFPEDQSYRNSDGWPWRDDGSTQLPKKQGRTPYSILTLQPIV